MSTSILGETNRDIGGVCMLDQMSVGLIPFENRIENEQSVETKAIHVNNQSFVTALELLFEDSPDGFLGFNPATLFEESESHRVSGFDD
ncbi:MAG: hypothetical protein AAB638_03575 [Patescibacteria group bacterium]